ncbi:trypsin-like peptidase domain-containing protein [Derxia gummosa]|uniref:Trypsin-like peptidase domain-containing protein n=1 Tax=Derxia gummosa DSM 723 TaxID=1121388 RepID=A0ABD8HKK5_9BURK
MQRRPIVSRSGPDAGRGGARSRGAAPGLPGGLGTNGPGAGVPEDPVAGAGAAVGIDAGSPVAPSRRVRFGGWLRRHERGFWFAALLAVGAVAGWGAWWRPDPVMPSMREIDRELRDSIARKPLASAIAAAQARVAPAVVRVRAEHDSPPADRPGGAARAGKSPAAPFAHPPGAPHAYGTPDARTDPQARSDPQPGPGPQARRADRQRVPGRDAPQSPDGSGPPAPPDGRSSIGTGVVVVADGTILTNLHVVRGHDRISVTFADGSESRADLVSADPRIDLAVLRARVVPDDLRPAVLRSTAGLEPGQEVVAIGFPFGLGPSTTAGVVSGLGRRFGAPETDAPMTGLIQFDAAANPGNSGGPLLTLDGAVVGIVTAILNPTPLDTFIGIGFAVPIEAAMGAVGMSPF